MNLSNENPRDLRKLCPPGKGTWKVPALGQALLFTRHMNHHSAQVYLTWINDDQKIARHWVITQKCELKSNGTATPTPWELQLWNTP